MEYTFADELISDLHKDAHGMRPSAAFMDAWLFDSDDGKQATWDYLVMVMKESQEQEKDAEAQALLVFKDKLRNIMADYGYAWKQALRKWFLETNGEMILKSFCGSKAYRMIKSTRSQGVISKGMIDNEYFYSR
jgi:hypothetical protein